MHTKSQEVQILDYLDKGHTLTPLEALQMFQCLRISARIWDLRRAGHIIASNTITLPNGKRVSEYSLIKKAS